MSSSNGQEDRTRSASPSYEHLYHPAALHENVVADETSTPHSPHISHVMVCGDLVLSQGRAVHYTKLGCYAGISKASKVEYSMLASKKPLLRPTPEFVLREH